MLDLRRAAEDSWEGTKQSREFTELPEATMRAGEAEQKRSVASRS